MALRFFARSRLARSSSFSFLLFSLQIVGSAQTGLTLGTNSVVYGPTNGTGSVVVGGNANWIAGTTASWLHIASGSQTGAGRGLVQFTYDANFGSTRSGTFVFNGGQATLAVTQAGQDYVATTEVTSLVSQVLSSPVIDVEGNVYFADVIAGSINKWTAATGEITALVFTGLKDPSGIAVDSSQNVYIADTGHNAIKKWTASSGQLTTLVYSLNQPEAVAVDKAFNVYIADTDNNAVEKWTAASGELSTIASSLNQPSGVAVDTNGNVYIADTGNKVVDKWTASNGQLTTFIGSGLTNPYTLSLDGAGNLYIADAGTIKQATSQGQVTTILSSHFEYALGGGSSDAAGNLSVTWSNPDHGAHGTAVSPPGNPFGAIYSINLGGDVAVDLLGNVYFDGNDIIGFRFIREWSPTTGQISTLFTNINAQFNGLAVDSIGELYFTSNPFSYPFGSILKLVGGQPVHVADDSFGHYPIGLAANQVGDVYFASASGSLYPPSTTDAIKKWTASTGQLTTLVPGLTSPSEVAIDAAGNVYFSVTYPSPVDTIEEWTASTGSISTLIEGPNLPKGNAPDTGVAVDGSGDVYFSSGGAIEKLTAATGQISILSTAILNPNGAFSLDAFLGAPAIKLDSLDNLYAVSYDAVRKLTRAFVGPATVVEPLASGSDQLLPVLPAGTPLDAVSDEPWLTITSQDSGVVQFSFASATTTRTAHISVLGQTIPVTQTDTTIPTVVSYSVLWGSQSYSLTESTRNRLPWLISGIRVVFSKPITSGDANSLGGVTATELSGLGTNTLTWTIDPVSVGSFVLSLTSRGTDALRDSDGNPVTGKLSQIMKVLLGDVNDDGVVNASDLALIIAQRQYSNNIFADVNGDGVVDNIDVEVVRAQVGSTLP